jgi:hypothetical protein
MEESCFFIYVIVNLNGLIANRYEYRWKSIYNILGEGGGRGF